MNADSIPETASAVRAACTVSIDPSALLYARPVPQSKNGIPFRMPCVPARFLFQLFPRLTPMISRSLSPSGTTAARRCTGTAF